MRWKFDRRRLEPILARYRPYVPVLVLLGVVGSVAESLGLSLIVLLLNALLGNTGFSSVPMTGTLGRIYQQAYALVDGRAALLAGLVLLLITARSITNVIYAFISSWLRHSLSDDVRGHLHAELFDLPYGWVRERDMGEWMTVLSADSWAIADAIYALSRVGTNICSIVIFGAFVAAISPSIALIAVAGSVAIFAVVERLGRRAAAMGERAVADNIALTDRILSGLQGMRTLRAFGAENDEKRRFRATSQHARDGFVAIDRLQALLSPITEISYLALLTGLVLVSGPLGVTIPATMTAVLLLYRMQPHVRELESNRMALIGHRASLQQVARLLALRDRGVPPDGERTLTSVRRAIRFDRVTFAYGETDAPVMRDLSFELPVGGVTAITGPSGVGKTTLIGLLLRLYRPDTGRILVDDVPLDEIARADWLARVALAGQDADLIGGSIADNLRVGRADANEAAMREAVTLAGLDSFIDSLPQGFDTEVGDRGLNMSGGQRQRMGLARALLRDPDVLVLDEATNALEDRLERDVYDRLRARFADRIIVLITHRAAGLPPADHVVRLGPPPAIG
ncbi:ABC transporter ATP-binding protein [Sphingomonas sp. LR60]|uniref:ABC transporter ATP-binding protein n=1 Tax=Sphingomonas sp. LR60 TaxID=3050233 RepID=UPI002FE0B519